MYKSRGSQIYDLILNSQDKKMHVSEVRKKLEEIFQESIDASVIPSTVRMDNRIRAKNGQKKRFCLYGDPDCPEQRGYISLNICEPKSDKLQIDLHEPVLMLIEAANRRVKANFERTLKSLEWRIFQKNILPHILLYMGYVILKMETDTGYYPDQIFQCKRGRNSVRAIISSSCWQTTGNDVSEVHRIANMDEFDIGVIVTASSSYSEAAIKANCNYYEKKIILLDLPLITDICLKNSIGFKGIELPQLYSFDVNQFNSIQQILL